MDKLIGHGNEGVGFCSRTELFFAVSHLLELIDVTNDLFDGKDAQMLLDRPGCDACHPVFKALTAERCFPFVGVEAVMGYDPQTKSFVGVCLESQKTISFLIGHNSCQDRPDGSLGYFLQVFL